MCILLKLPYAKFDISRLFCSKVMEEKPLGDRLDSPPPPLGKGRVKPACCCARSARNIRGGRANVKYSDLIEISGFKKNG